MSLLAKTDLSGSVLVLGSEGGARRTDPQSCKRRQAVTLEIHSGQATGVISYNVAVVAGILCYDVPRRRIAKSACVSFVGAENHPPQAYPHEEESRQANVPMIRSIAF